MSKVVTPLRISRWPATWALAAALSLATFVLMLRSCAVVAESDALSSFIATSRRVLGIGVPR